MMDLTPLEVRKKKGDFRRAMRGYEPALVDDFLDLVADRLEQLVRDNMALAERSARHEKEVAEFRDRERALTEALVTAQEMREEMRRQAVREAELALKAAEQESGKLRSAVEQEVAHLRAEAQMDAQAVRSSAQQDATALRNAVTQELMQMRSATEAALHRTQEAVRALQARQQQSLTTYRSWLERELSELHVIANTMAAGEPAGKLIAGVPTADLEPFSPELVLDEDGELHAVEDPALPVGLPLAGSLDIAGVDEAPVEQDEPAESGRGRGRGRKAARAAEPEMDEDAGTSALLRNAAAAGYVVPDEDDLLGDGPDAGHGPEAADDPEDEGWLPDVLEDER